MILRKTAILVSGRGSNMEALIKASMLETSSFSIEVVISDNPKAEAVEKAKTMGIFVEIVDYSKYNQRKNAEKQILSILQKYTVQTVFLAGFMKIIGTTLLDAYPNNILNIHPSLLPSFKGLNAQKQALDFGVKITGCTIHIVNEKVDEGTILSQVCVPINSDDTVYSLSDKILEEEHILYPKTANNFVRYKYDISKTKAIKRISQAPKEFEDRFDKLHFSGSYEKELDKIQKSSKPVLLVSACLLGIPCRYDGKSKYYQNIEKYYNNYEILPICPEVLSGFSIPRNPMEFEKGDGQDLLKGKAILKNNIGINVTENMLLGAKKAIYLAKKSSVSLAILKARSPSCGIDKVYQQDLLINGKGVFAALMNNAKITCMSEEDIK